MLIELAPDASTSWVRILDWNEYGRVTPCRMHGTRDGGEFENLFFLVIVANETVATHFEVFALEDRDAALARFEELSVEKSAQA